MLECPFCGEQVRPQNNTNGFRCPNQECRNWIRLRASQNRSAWLEPGVRTDGRFQPILLVSPPEQRDASTSAQRRPASGTRRNYPNVDELDLQAVRTQRQEAATRRRQLDEQIDETYRLRANNLQNEPLVRRYNTDLSRYFEEQNDLQQLAQQLADREAALQEEQRRAQPASSSNVGWQFGCSMFVAAAALVLFTRLINLSLDSHAITVLILIAFGSGVATFIIAQIN